MVFSSIPFLYYFLPAVLILYFIVPDGLKNLVLLLASLFFYGWGEPGYVPLMLCSILLGYVFGLLIQRYREGKWGSVLLALSVLSNVAILGYFKYADFFLENFNAVTGLSVPLLKIALPIGISFYTFQILSYTIDVWRGQAAQRNLISLAAYVAMFPQLIAGPIVRYSDIAGQLIERKHSLKQTSLGIRRFVLGLGKKVLIANQLGELCQLFFSSGDPSVLFCWLYAIAFTLHIYFDFSGYSDMAIGLGRILGFTFPENFNYPYLSRSVTEFWRRWHISLGSWFRDYVYIPLGGNRVSRGKWLRNVFLVWLLTGFWHGAAWTFILWGLWFGLLLAAEKLLWGRALEEHRVLSRLYVLLAVVFSFVLFNAQSVGDALGCMAGMVGLGGLPVVSQEALYYLAS
ncbi:MAG: MBOAT family protein, partial [Oscillospiraceae bacterium]|nr:MBOAT family protein [Oscillospiraceae bacterium]